MIYKVRKPCSRPENDECFSDTDSTGFSEPVMDSDSDKDSIEFSQAEGSSSETNVIGSTKTVDTDDMDDEETSNNSPCILHDAAIHTIARPLLAQKGFNLPSGTTLAETMKIVQV